MKRIVNSESTKGTRTRFTQWDVPWVISFSSFVDDMYVRWIGNQKMDLAVSSDSYWTKWSIFGNTVYSSACVPKSQLPCSVRHQHCSGVKISSTDFSVFIFFNRFVWHIWGIDCLPLIIVLGKSVLFRNLASYQTTLHLYLFLSVIQTKSSSKAVKQKLKRLQSCSLISTSALSCFILCILFESLFP